MISCIYYLDVLSSWCYFADVTLRRVLQAHEGTVDVSYALVPIEALPSRDEQLRVYRRSQTITGIHTTAWINKQGTSSTWDANAACLAAPLVNPEINFHDVRSRLAEAALLHGRQVGDPEEALKYVSEEFAIDRALLRKAVESRQVREQLEENRSAFDAAGLTVRPSFVLRNAIQDHIVLGGQYEFGILSLAIDSLRGDEEAYELFNQANPVPSS